MQKLVRNDTISREKTAPDFGDASPQNTNWAGVPTSDYRKLQKFFSNKVIKVSLFDITI